MFGSEDIVIHQSHGIAFISSCDHRSIAKGVPTNGSILLYEVNASKVKTFPCFFTIFYFPLFFSLYLRPSPFFFISFPLILLIKPRSNKIHSSVQTTCTSCSQRHLRNTIHPLILQGYPNRRQFCPHGLYLLERSKKNKVFFLFYFNATQEMCLLNELFFFLFSFHLLKVKAYIFFLSFLNIVYI